MNATPSQPVGPRPPRSTLFRLTSRNSGLRVRLRRWLRSIVRARGTPEAIARGFAIGLFVGFTPTTGLQMFLAAVLATALGGSRIPAIAATWVTNPLTGIFLYSACYKLGAALLGCDAGGNWARLKETLAGEGGGPWLSALSQQLTSLARLGWDIVLPLLVGCCLVGVVSALISYPVVIRLAKGHQLVRARKRARRWQKHVDQRRREPADP